MIFIRDETNVHMSISRVVGYQSIAIRELGVPELVSDDSRVAVSNCSLAKVKLFGS